MPRATMAELVDALPPSEGPPVPWVQPIRDGSWTDEDGSHWQMRRSVSIRRIERLMKSADARVLLCYGPDAPQEVPLLQREALWRRALPYLEDRPRRPGDSTDFSAAEFSSPDDRSMVIFERSC